MKQPSLLIFLLAIPLSTISFARIHEWNRPQLPIVIVTASYNNASWYQWNLDSVIAQQYINWRMIYIDDCSTDDTGNLVDAYLKEKGMENKITLIRNTERKRAMHNLYEAIHSCRNNEIIIILDGDDRLAHDTVLAHINGVYQNTNIWLTYGQFKEYPSGAAGFCIPMPDFIVQENAFRDFHSGPSHLRTFYAGLFKQIKKEDLMLNGSFLPMTCDLATMFPMIEMARNGHFAFIPDILLEYNASNALNDHKISKKIQRDCDLFVRQLPRYAALESVDLSGNK